MLKEKKTHGPDETRLGVRGKVTVIIQTADECRRGTRRAAAYFCFIFDARRIQPVTCARRYKSL